MLIIFKIETLNGETIFRPINVVGLNALRRFGLYKSYFVASDLHRLQEMGYELKEDD